MSSYIINKTDGSILAVVESGTIDSSSCSLSLVGKNTDGYGEVIAENLVKLLENFANSSPPLSPVVGQLWFDTNTKEIRLFTGTLWQSINPEDSYSLSKTSVGTGAIVINNDSDPFTVGASARFVIGVSGGVINFKVGSSSGNLETLMQFDYVNRQVTIPNTGSLPNSLVQKSYVDGKTSISNNRTSVSASDSNIINQVNGEDKLKIENSYSEFYTVVKALTPVISDSGNTLTTKDYVDSQINQFRNNAVFFGDPKAPSTPVGNIGESIANTRFVDERITFRFTNANLQGNSISVTPPISDNSARIATTSFVGSKLEEYRNNLQLLGIPTAPQPAQGSNSDQIATTRFVNTVVANGTERWSGSRKFVSRDMPSQAVGSDGDFWFRIE